MEVISQHVLYCVLSHLGHGGDFSACVLYVEPFGHGGDLSAFVLCVEPFGAWRQFLSMLLILYVEPFGHGGDLSLSICVVCRTIWVWTSSVATVC